MDPAQLRPFPAIEALIAISPDSIEVSQPGPVRAPAPKVEHIDTLDACPLLSELLYDFEPRRQAEAAA